MPRSGPVDAAEVPAVGTEASDDLNVFPHACEKMKDLPPFYTAMETVDFKSDRWKVKIDKARPAKPAAASKAK